MEFILTLPAPPFAFTFVIPNVTLGGGCADTTVENSDTTYSSSVASGATLVLPDTTFNVYIDGALNQSSTIVTLGNETINISL